MFRESRKLHCTPALGFYARVRHPLGMDTGQSTCKDNEELLSVGILLGFMCNVGVEVLTIVKSKVFPCMSRSET